MPFCLYICPDTITHSNKNPHPIVFSRLCLLSQKKTLNTIPYFSLKNLLWFLYFPLKSLLIYTSPLILLNLQTPSTLPLFFSIYLLLLLPIPYWFIGLFPWDIKASLGFCCYIYPPKKRKFTKHNSTLP